MAKKNSTKIELITNANGRPVFVDPTRLTLNHKFCSYSYEEYEKQRKRVKVGQDQIQKMTSAYKKKVAEPMMRKRPKIEMGDYFVIPVQEVKDMLASCPEAQFIHITNALKSTKNSKKQTIYFPVALLSPVAKSSEKNRDCMDCPDRELFDMTSNKSIITLESYPCPPDPRCPKNEMIGTILRSDTKIATFKSLD